MAGVQTFDEKFLGNANVPKEGMKTSLEPPTIGVSAGGMPPGVDQADGTANIKSDGVHKYAAPLSPNASGTVRRPPGVNSFQDRSV